MVEFLLGHGGERIINAQDCEGRTPLNLAVSAIGSTVHEEIIKLLCYHGADREVADNLGRTPVSLAMDRGRVRLARTLLEFMANSSDRE